MSYFKNLAGNSDASQQILYELKYANIPVIEMTDNIGEVPSPYVGYLGVKNLENIPTDKIINIHDFFKFTFYRRWTYYSVSGLVPFLVAKKINEIHRNDIRVNGYAGGTDVENHLTWYADDGSKLALKKELNGLSEKIRQTLLDNKNYLFVDKYEGNGNPYIDLYHIDTQEGLDYFVKALEDNNIV